MFTILLAIACAPAPTDTDADTDTGTALAPSPALSAHTLTGACIQGRVVTLDIGTDEPLQYAVEVRYARGQAEPMVPAPYARASTMVSTDEADHWDSPLYRDGSQLVFTCGYAWEAQGPTIDGDAAGMAVGYRVTWLVLE